MIVIINGILNNTWKYTDMGRGVHPDHVKSRGRAAGGEGETRSWPGRCGVHRGSPAPRHPLLVVSRLKHLHHMQLYLVPWSDAPIYALRQVPLSVASHYRFRCLSLYRHLRRVPLGWGAPPRLWSTVVLGFGRGWPGAGDRL